MKRMLRTAAALLLGASLLVTGASAAATQFDDVPANHWAYSYVTRAAQEGLVSGMGDGVYGESEPLNLGEFATMICQLLYPEADDAYAGRSSYWWYQYVEAAYQKGDLTGTVAGNRRASDGAWTATVVEADMNRYDLAQIIFNVMNSQDWETPDTALVALALATIPDREDIPDSYQAAVAMAYAGGFLTGMDDKGTFGGEGSMTRAQAAVVLCALLDAKQEMDAPTYTNRAGKLVNGSDANEDNVRQAISGLRQEFYEFYIYDTDRTYTSQRLGTASGGQGFAYMFSDRVFGALPAQEQDDPDQLKPGDLVSLDGEYQVVTDVSGNSYNYVSCDSLGIVYWRTDGRIDDIGSRDTIWTRYEGVVDRDLDEADVEDLIDQFLDEEYDVGEYCDECDDGYESPAFGRSTYYDDRAFAYYLSDYIFGEDAEVDSEVGDWVDIDDIRAGDVIYLYDRDLYVVVTDVDTRNDEISYLYTNSNGRIRSDVFDFSILDEDDTVYTRYEGQSSSSDSRDDLDENDVADLIDDFLKDSRDGYAEGDPCYESEHGYKSSKFGTGTFYDDQAFAYYMSDYIFGKTQDVDEMDGDEVDIDDIRLGDIIDYDDGYYVVTSVNTSKERMTCLYTDRNDKVAYTTLDLENFTRYDTTIYTRYDGGAPNSSSGSLTTREVKNLIEDFRDEEYDVGNTCDECEIGYRSSEFRSGTAKGSEAFAYYMSDYIFGKSQEVEMISGNKVYFKDVRLGDVIYLDEFDRYGVIVALDEDEKLAEYLYARDSDGKVRNATLDPMDMGSDDTLYTRY